LILPILTHENPLLHEPSCTVTKFDAYLVRLADDMAETMVANNGIGLAAVQVGTLLRVIVCQPGGPETREVYVNPKIVDHMGVYEPGEGCLSIPNREFKIKRWWQVLFRAQTIEGKDVEIVSYGAMAHILQHEIDHTNGILCTAYEAEAQREREAIARGD
jgi:peptide deformylase